MILGVMRRAISLVNSNPRYALAVGACEVQFAKSPKFSLTSLK